MKWQEFKKAIQEEAPASSKFAVTREDGSSRMLFRGHADCEWNLESTLERAGHSTIGLGQYMRYCDAVRKYVGSIIPTTINFDSKAECDLGAPTLGIEMPNYEYLAYLRHHGFPSPLVDWSESPFVAAFFAFRNIQRGVERVRVLGYRETKRYSRIREMTEPGIEILGPVANIQGY